jgi:hypothetical protein
MVTLAAAGLALAAGGARPAAKPVAGPREGAEEAFAWGTPLGGVRVGIRVRKVPGVKNLFAFVTVAENLNGHAVRIAFGNYGAGPQHPIYQIHYDQGGVKGCIIPPRANGMPDPHNPQPEFPMSLPAGKVTVLYTSTFVPPLAPGKHWIQARVPQAIYACQKAEDPKWRAWVLEETRGTIGSALDSGMVKLKME